MPTTIKLRNSVTTTSAPSSLVQGEVAINITDKKVWVGNAATTPIQLLGDGGSGSFTSIAFGAGTVSSPSITFTGDTNTGIYSPAADTIAFTEGGVESGRFTSTGALQLNANLTFSGTGNRITGDFSNATVANRLLFQTSTTDGNSIVGIIPNGTSTTSALLVETDSSTTNSSFAQVLASSTEISFRSGRRGSGTQQPMTFHTNGAERLRIDTSGNVGIGTSSPAANTRLTLSDTNTVKLRLTGGSSQNGYLLEPVSGSNQYYVGAGNNLLNIGDKGFLIFDVTNSRPKFFAEDVNGETRTLATTFLTFHTNAAERMRIDSSGNVGVGTTSPSTFGKFAVVSADGYNSGFSGATTTLTNYIAGDLVYLCAGPSSGSNGKSLVFQTGNSGLGSERMRITSGGDICFAKTSSDTTTLGGQFTNAGSGFFYLGVTNTSSTSTHSVIYVNRQSSDGELIAFRQADTTEGNISVSGTTVSYNGGHLSRYAQTLAPKDNSLLKGTVLSNLDEMNEYVDAEGNQVDNEQLNKVKVSDVEGDVNVAGVFVNWSHDEAHNVDEINMAMTGDMIIRIAQGVVVQKGDLLISAGDGTAKPQGDDIVRSKTVAKVTSNHVTCTYADGSYCVPCVLMAC